MQRMLKKTISRLQRNHGPSSSISLPRLTLPRLPISAVDLPKVDLPHVELPRPALAASALHVPDLATAGRAVSEVVDAAAQRAEGLGHDLARGASGWRLTRERDHTAAGLGVGLLTGLGLGLAAMFFFDPRAGRRRRAILRDRTGALMRSCMRDLRGEATHLKHRAEGVAATVRSTASDVAEGARPSDGLTTGEERGGTTTLEAISGAASDGSGSRVAPVGLGVNESDGSSVPQ